MRKLVSLYFWFKAALVAGLVLALLLLVQSVAGYLHVSRQLVTDQSQREAERLAQSLERELRRPGTWDPVRFQETMEEMLAEARGKISWIRMSDISGQPLIQVGRAKDSPVAAGRLKETLAGREAVSQEFETGGREVTIHLFPLRFRRPAKVPPESGGPLPNPAVGMAAAPRLIEVAIYRDSVAAAFGPLRRDLIISCLAALGLASAIMLLWIQLPRYMRGKQIDQQLELARRVQADLLPPANPDFKDWNIAASCIPALQVGGDFYDLFATDHNRMALVLGDVSGKGVPAALLMGLLHGAIRSIRWSHSAERHESSTARLNDFLSIRTAPERFASLFWCYFNAATQVLHYVNAGHLPPAIMRRNGSGEWKIQRLDEGGPILGAIPHVRYRQGQAPIHPGDLLILYSDGLVEAHNDRGEEYGEEKIWNAARNHWTRSPADIRDAILSEVRSFVPENRLEDDMTLVVMRMENGIRPAVLSDGSKEERPRSEAIESDKDPIRVAECGAEATEGSSGMEPSCRPGKSSFMRSGMLP